MPREEGNQVEVTWCPCSLERNSEDAVGEPGPGGKRSSNGKETEKKKGK